MRAAACLRVSPIKDYPAKSFMKLSRPIPLVVAAMLGLFFIQSTFAVQITPGFTFSVASAGSSPSTGNHFHSNTGGAFGNPAGKAEVGSFSSETVRGLSEYDLAGLATGPAFVTFNVFNDGGLFSGTNDFPFDGIINVFSYQGNNTEDIADYQASPATFVGSFATAGLSVGNTVSLDITSQYNAALAAPWNSLGIRLERAGGAPTGTGAWTFDMFRLTSSDESTSSVPDGGATLMLFGLAMAGLTTFRLRP